MWATGNDGTLLNCEGEWEYLLDNAIFVGNSAPTGQDSSFANFGMQVTILAPGEEIPTTNSEGEIVISNGTSFAAPQITGADDLILLRKAAALDPTNTTIRDSLATIAGFPLMSPHFIVQLRD